MPIHLRRVDHDPFVDPNVQPVVFGGEKGATNVGPGPQGPADIAAARVMAQQGKNSDQIFASTGWYRGSDGNWKWILSDKNAELNPASLVLSLKDTGIGLINFRKSGEPLKLKDVLHHDDLYKAYPHLADARVISLDPRTNAAGALASYDYNTNTVQVSNVGRPREELTRTLLHEIQHGIQSEENFGSSRGGMQQYLPANLGSKQTAAYKTLENLYKDASSKLIHPDWVHNALLRKLQGIPLSDDEKEILKGAEHSLGSETFSKFVDVANQYHDLNTTVQKADKSYRSQSGETEAFQTEWQRENQNYDTMPKDIPGFASASEQTVWRPGLLNRDRVTPGVQYQMADKEALPTTPAPFDPWDSGRSMAPTDIAPLTDVSEGIRDYARDVVTGEVARRGLGYYNQNPMEAGLALSGGGLGIKRIGPPEGNIIRVGEPPKTYEAATGDIHAAIAPENVRGYALDIAPGAGSQVRTLNPAQNPQITMQQVTPLRGPQGEPWPQRGELPAGVERRRVEAENTNAPTYPIAGGYRLMPAFTKKDQWSIIDPRGEIMFRSPDKATTQKVFDFVNKGTTGLAVGGALAGGEAQAAQPSMQYTWPGPQSQAEPQGYDLQEVDHDPFTPGIQTASQVQPRQIPFTPPQAISTLPWSFGNNAPDATPTRFSDIAPPLNYYQPLSNTNGVPTYGG